MLDIWHGARVEDKCIECDVLGRSGMSRWRYRQVFSDKYR